MLNLALPVLGTPGLDIGNILINHPSLVKEIGGHALAHVLYSYARRAGSRRRNRRRARKSMNRRRRWFVDNIIMHHKRLHDRNRELVITNARSRVLAKREAEKKHLSLLKTPQKEPDKSRRWRDSEALKSRAGEIRDRVDARRARAKSRWVSVVGEVKKDEAN